MKLGVDARKLWDGGIGTYIRELLQGLARRADAPPTVVFARARSMDAVARMIPAAERVANATGLYSFGEHVSLPRAARRAGVTLFHAPHYTLPVGWTGRSVVTVHDLIHLRHPEFFPAGAALFARAVAGHAVRRARIVMTDSEHTRSDVIEMLRTPAERVRAVPLAVPQGLTPPDAGVVEAFRTTRGLPTGYMLYVGARKRHKNLGLVLRALGRVALEMRPPFVLAGDPWTENDPHAVIAREAGVESCIHFAGQLNDSSELACLYSGAALYVQPSLVEGFGLPPLEAMACGVPVLASAGGSLPEVLSNAAELLPPEDPDAWADAIERLLGEAGLRDTLVARGRARAAARSWDDVAADVLAIYREAAGE